MSESVTGQLTDLRSAFAAEAMNALRYAYFAEVAEIEGYADVARLFHDMAATATCAAHGHLDFLRLADDPRTFRPFDDTRGQLIAALAGAAEEGIEFYPRLAGRALNHGQADLASWLQTLSALKCSHEAKLERTLGDFDEPSSGVPSDESRAGR